MKENPDISIYEDIINLPHHVSPNRQPMSREERAAQFSPFAALTGYESAVQETARLTQSQRELDRDSRELLDMKQRLLNQFTEDHPEIKVIYFRQDKRKAGGAYLEIQGRLKKIDPHQRLLLLMEGEAISLDNILDIESPLFRGLG